VTHVAAIMEEKVTSCTSGNVDTCYKPHACQYLTDTDIQSWKNTSLPSLTQIHDVHVQNFKETVSQLPPSPPTSPLSFTTHATKPSYPVLPKRHISPIQQLFSFLSNTAQNLVWPSSPRNCQLLRNRNGTIPGSGPIRYIASVHCFRFGTYGQ
jgi:hypothetical protein